MEALLTPLSKFVVFSEDEQQSIAACFETTNLRKKQNLVNEGSVCKCLYFVAKGCLRMFFVKDTGVEQTTHFALENWWLTDYFSFLKQEPTEFYIQAVEPTQVLAIKHHDYERLMQQLPQLEKYFRYIHQRESAAAQRRIKYLYGCSKEDSYHHFNNSFPEFIQRIPQYLLASYLDITPEYLSELRKKSFLKPA
jgi:CRP/FNR family transcriptional regulator